MPRLSLKPDSSFFRKIAIGAVGARAVHTDLTRHGHQTVELERGSMDSKLWKEVKRKRVRIPDLLCIRCGLRVESRAKTAPELSMSHSFTDEARSWDFGMVDKDLVAFPVCEAVEENFWSAGRLGPESSYWHERNWVRWKTESRVNYFTVSEFRRTPHARSSTKGVTEGTETAISWRAIFSTRRGVVEAVAANKVAVRRESDNHRYTWTIPQGLTVCVHEGEQVDYNQVLASSVCPLKTDELACSGVLDDDHIPQLLSSRERTQRFTGVKLARLLRRSESIEIISAISSDTEEDVYVRLEAISYLCSVGGESARSFFDPYLQSADQQTQLEAVITLGDTATQESVELLSEILDDHAKPYFIRSAAAWCLSKAGSEGAAERLVRAFSDVSRDIREEALSGIISVGGAAIPLLLAGLREADDDLAAGCAEALRQQTPLPEETLSKLLDSVRAPHPSKWVVWLLGHVPREQIASSIADLQNTAPELHYAVSLLWSFLESWIARRWETFPGYEFPKSEVDDAK